eukprot:GDKI01008171.1.p2 GENE.GDKI01008171.1~~GDKI01008171.1.p2  ORF type:complete len:114 (+),score=22.78 GDKI01008171.1:84-425(+)
MHARSNACIKLLKDAKSIEKQRDTLAHEQRAVNASHHDLSHKHTNTQTYKHTHAHKHHTHHTHANTVRMHPTQPTAKLDTRATKKSIFGFFACYFGFLCPAFSFICFTLRLFK